MSSHSAEERGSVSAFVVCLFPALIGLGMFMHDSGSYVDRYLRASDIAENAARIGAQSIVGIRSGDPHIDQRRSSQLAHDYLRSEGLSGRVASSGTRVSVTVEAFWDSRVFRILGMRRIIVTRSASVVDG